MVGTLINVGAIILASAIGVLLKGRLSDRYSRIIIRAMGLVTLILGVTMAIKAEQMILIVVSLVVGSLLGEFLSLDQRFNRAATALRSALPSSKGKATMDKDRFTEGFVTATLLFCVGSMAILGPIQEASGQEPTLLLTKSVMDGISAMFFAASFGIGVMLSAAPVLIYQGAISLFSSSVMTFLSPETMTELSATGGILLVGLGISILGMRNLNVINMLPSLVIIVILCLFFQ